MREALRGATAILTRASEDNELFARDLRAQGVRVLELPCVSAAPLDDVGPLADALRSLGHEDWLVVTSRAGADALARVARGAARVAAIGPGTAARLGAHGIAVAFIPSHA
ncbi:MAG: uroporphyrinogen-III synthase, partial [Chloroflexota bacterium]